MIRLLSVFLVLLALSPILAQNRRIDSLQTVLATPSQADTLLGNRHNELPVARLRKDQQLQPEAIRLQRQLRYTSLAVLVLIASLLTLLYSHNSQKKQANRLWQELQHQRDQTQQALTDLKTTQTQLVQKEKMASLGELTAGIAHEIQNPLNFVNNFSEVSAEMVDELVDEHQKPQPDADLETELLTDLKANLTKILHHGQRASSIVRGMLEHSRNSSGEVQPTNLNALADEFLRLAYHGLRAKDQNFNCDLVTQFDSTLGQVPVMPQEMGRVLLNLFTNAFYAVRERQKQGEATYKPTITVSTLKTKTGIQIRVTDNGTGMSRNVQEKIFQPFFTTKPTGEGTGLGLSLSYDIVTKGHGGTLTVESQEGEGTEFIIQLPAS
ncbi:sensor histidine kinase [Spirosoma areae]